MDPGAKDDFQRLLCTRGFTALHIASAALM
jgi:hypothetical protein